MVLGLILKASGFIDMVYLSKLTFYTFHFITGDTLKEILWTHENETTPFTVGQEYAIMTKVNRIKTYSSKCDIIKYSRGAGNEDIN